MGRRSWNYQDMMVGQESKGGEPLCTTPLRQVPITSSGGDTRSGSSSPMAGGWYLRPGSPEPQPLDLSAKPPKPPASPPPLNKHIFKAKPRLSAVGGRRSYTEDELQAALRDIQSGKLGTRRAAVIYGIPRSTLRNKVYKLTQESRDFAGSEDRPDPDPDDDDDDDDRDLSGAEEERETERVLMRPIFSIEDVMRLTRDVTWPCLTQLLGGGASTSAEDPLRVPSFRTPVRNGGSPPPPGQLPGPLKSDQPLDFRREPVIRNHNNNHLEEKKLSPGGTKQQHHQQQQQQQQGGKGTRPKRGKYRNYDRDSLVEAVRAVQRGEMSVHRAGSYYGVPHSTLEYKVKERHLMRPRKREPKPQPEEKRKEDEKRPAPAPAARPARVTPPLPSNGLKMPALFDPALAYRPPFPFWQAPFPPLPLDYASRPELFPGQAGSAAHPLNTATREIAESLLESSGENGSFLDGIIRSSLASGLPGGREAAGKVLLEQLCRGGSIIDKPSSSGSPPPPPPSTTSPHTRTPSTSPNC